MKHPLSKDRAKRLIVEILKSGTLSFSNHAQEEMAADKLDEVDVRNTLRGGWCALVELRTGSWRYRFETNQQGAVIVFRSETHAVVVTVFRFKKR